MSEQKKDSPKDNKGFFFIYAEAIEKLIDSNASAMTIATYLILARHTDRSGMYVSCGYKAISKALRISSRTAEGLIEELLTYSYYPKLIHKTKEWQKKKDNKIPEINHEYAKINWVLPEFSNSEKILIPNTLVDGYKRFKNPLRSLCQCGNVAARLLIMLYKHNDMTTYGGIPPYLSVYRKYNIEKERDITLSQERFTFSKISKETESTKTCFMNSIKENSKDDVAFWNALQLLEEKGFIYEVITVFSGDATNSLEALPLYFLRAKTKASGEDGLYKKIANIFSLSGISITDKLGRFYGTYGVIYPESLDISALGMYRLRFRVANSKSFSVRESMINMSQIQEEWENKISEIETYLKPQNTLVR